MDLAARIKDLQQRGVLRVGAVYIAAAFAAIQAADLIFPRLGLADWTITAVIILALAGFPCALVCAFLFNIERDRRSAGAETGGRPSLQTPVFLMAVVLLPVFGIGAWYASNHVVDSNELDPQLVAVLPFRVSGASEDLSYLREGMVDLLSALLGGTRGMRAVDSRTVLSEWRSAGGSSDIDLRITQAKDVARAVNAGQLLLGEVVGTPEKIVVTASLVSVRRDQVTNAAVAGSAADLPRIVDKLAAILLMLIAEEDQRYTQTLFGTPLRALRSYLEGRRAYRSGAYTDAISHYRDALSYDSTFALAAFGLARAGSWVNNAALAQGNAIAWKYRNRLPARDRVLFEASVGSRYPSPLTGREWIDGAQNALRIAPDDPDAWYAYADALYHMGGVAGEERALERARDAFTRAAEVDSTFGPPLLHLADLAALQGDTAALEKVAARFLAHDSVGEAAEIVRWLRAAATNDERALAHIWARIDSMPPLAVAWIAGISQARQVRPQDRGKYDVALDSPSEITPFLYYLNAGRPGRALHAKGLQLLPPPDQMLWLLPMVMFGGLDTALATPAVAVLEETLRAPFSADTAARLRQYTELCAIEEWRTLHGDLRTVQRSIARLRSANLNTDGIHVVDRAHRCAVFLDAIAAVKEKRANARAAVARLERLALQGPMTQPFRYEGNLVLASLWDQLGDKQRALAAVRRRSRVGFPPIAFLSTYLREEGRLAMEAGDSNGSRRAYAHYLSLRPDPEPSARAEVERVRHEFASKFGSPSVAKGRRSIEKPLSSPP